MRRTLALIALATPLAACGVSKEVYLQKESELAACRTDLASGEAALATCRQDLDVKVREAAGSAAERDACLRELDAGKREALTGRANLESCLAEKAGLQRATAEAPAAAAARQKAEQEAAACRDERARAQADLTACRGDAEAAKREVETLKVREGELRARLEKELQEKTVEIDNLKARLAVHVVDRILFDSGSAEILPAGKAILDKVAAVVSPTKEQIRVEGHTDDVPVSKRLKRKFFSNWELSAARAASVVRYFEYGKGIDPSRMEAVGLGFYRPEVANDSFEGRAQNRRVVIVLTAPAQPPAAGAGLKP